jgi:hypothetical protein
MCVFRYGDRDKYMLTHESRFLGILISHEYNQSPLHNINLNMNKLLGLNAIQSYHEL